MSSPRLSRRITKYNKYKHNKYNYNSGDTLEDMLISKSDNSSSSSLNIDINSNNNSYNTNNNSNGVYDTYSSSDNYCEIVCSKHNILNCKCDIRINISTDIKIIPMSKNINNKNNANNNNKYKRNTNVRYLSNSGNVLSQLSANKNDLPKLNTNDPNYSNPLNLSKFNSTLKIPSISIDTNNNIDTNSDNNDNDEPLSPDLPLYPNSDPSRSTRINPQNIKSDLTQSNSDSSLASSHSSLASSYGNMTDCNLTFFECYQDMLDPSVISDINSVKYERSYIRSKGSLGQVIRSLIDMHDRIIPTSDYQMKLYSTIKMIIADYIPSYSNIYKDMNNKCSSYNESIYIMNIIYKNKYINTQTRYIPKHEMKPYEFSQIKETFKTIIDWASFIIDQAESDNIESIDYNNGTVSNGIRFLSDDNISITIPNDKLINNIINFCEELIGITNKAIMNWDMILQELKSKTQSLN